jgi:hypothetical protein
MVKQVLTKAEPYVIVRMQPPRNDNTSTLVRSPQVQISLVVADVHVQPWASGGDGAFPPSLSAQDEYDEVSEGSAGKRVCGTVIFSSSG